MRPPNLSRLCQAIQRDRLVLRYPRQQRVDAVRQSVGIHYSEEGASKEVPVNMIGLYVKIMTANLVAKNPRVLLSTWDRNLVSMVKGMQGWVNKKIEEMHLSKTLARVVVDALYSMGIARVALTTPAESAATSWNNPAGVASVSLVDEDDWVYDTHARDFEHLGYEGHRMRVPIDAVKDSRIYSGRARRELSPADDNFYNPEGDEKLSMIGRTTLSGTSQEFEDYVDLWEIYLPRYKLVYTLSEDQLVSATPHEPLRVQRWIGPDCGPYHRLGYGIVPGNARPDAPIHHLIDLHEQINRIYRKLGRQSDRQKTNTFVQGGATEDGKRSMDASDGEILRVDNPEALKIVDQGGINAANLQFAIHLKDLFERFGGNLGLIGGMESQSKTLGQDRMLEENASGEVASMQQDTIDFSAGVLKAMCWYWWKDPFTAMKTMHSVPGLPQFQATRLITPQERQRGRFEDIDLSIEPYSMQRKTPQQRMAEIDDLIQKIILPLMPLLQQQGINFNMQAYLQKAEQLRDIPDLSDIVTIGDPPDQGAASTPEQPGMAPQTTRNYVRRSLGGNTPQGRQQATMNSLVGAGAAQGKNGSLNGSVQ